MKNHERPIGSSQTFVFYVLRSSVAALATPDAAKLFAVPNEGHNCVRLARRADVPSIQRCNLATLPENYNSQFYVSHMRQWSALALVAEHVLPQQHENNHYNSRHSREYGQPQEPNIVGYCLGKVEDWVVDPPSSKELLFPSDLTQEELYEFQCAQQELKIREARGRVTSLAVLDDYRRKGLAAAMMNQLHCHMEQSHGVTGVGLHVRQTNIAATDGYRVEESIPTYYQDGEDAFYMRKVLNPI